MASGNVEHVKQAWKQLEREGHATGMDALFELCHPECEFRPAASRGEVLHGVEAARLFFREQRNAGADIKVSAYSFRQKEDSVEVLGWIRLLGADGVMADSQGRWTYRFRDGQIVEADYSPATVAAA
ncbi:MAG: nuclear transport factor 2 family protein [Thermoleophilaceae bacterium]|jgi:ketosteroid isomerase-like protein